MDFTNIIMFCACNVTNTTISHSDFIHVIIISDYNARIGRISHLDFIHVMRSYAEVIIYSQFVSVPQER